MALIEVGDNQLYSTVQAAVNAAPDGGSVLVGASLATADQYAEAITINNKRINLVGRLPLLGVQLTGAGGGAAPAVLVTGTGGVNLINFEISNAGSAATYVVEANVAEDWFKRLLVRGSGNPCCMQAQFLENVIAADAADQAIVASCQGSIFATQVTVVNAPNGGLVSGYAGHYQACLGYNCGGAAFISGAWQHSGWNAADDTSPPGPLPLRRLTLAEIAFVNYAGGNYRLTPGTLAFNNGLSPLDADLLGYRRQRRSAFSRIVSGAHDPWPDGPDYATGAASIRTV